ncbi:A/G-specific adenine glycosylase [Alkalibacillus haloalkaliphilus]|uniref:A/G-specific adenine glycosylase n=1 Tax=Alkalibacillus haloalkaliphilus TaxID=94136 RepID=UPI0029357DCA|nr:A/G-specific adenine glycosylase [Alkalibacillus haloalkaliphilus]MDV2581873.1 A/G-specific adenine glycosylase [Alkalibacillus haloalkaliphilus]
MTKTTSISIPILFNREAFQQDLINWYSNIKRDLPWRENQDPYRIWVSEIMLQQTQVDTVIPYFEQFMERYPTVYELAKADQQDVLKSWEGLGYYSRARNLHEAVKEVVTSYDGEVPNNKKELKKLKGIGSYTQGAILSIAFDQAEPAVDGNVMRVMSRVLHIEEDIARPKTKTMFEDVVTNVMSQEDPSSFNQGLMELGALICQPKKPKCEQCPVQQHCLAYERGTQTKLPVKTKAKKQKREAFFTLILKNENDQYFIEQRPEEGLLASLWQFPMFSQSEFDEEDFIKWFELEHDVKLNVRSDFNQVRHVFSHVIWELDLIVAELNSHDSINLKGNWVEVNELKAYPFPNVQQKVMGELGLN